MTLYKSAEQAFDPDDVPRALTVAASDSIDNGFELSVHSHRKSQLILTLRGLVTCEADRGVWIVPPRCALWIPGGMPHSTKGTGDLQVYCLSVEPDAMPGLPRECCTLSISPLLQELLLYLAHLPELYDEQGPDGRVATVLLEQLAASPIEKLNFPMPTDEKLRRIADAMMADPSDRATIAEWSRRVGAAERTLTRILLRETGLSFGRWRQQLYILIALQRLVQGGSVQTVALDLGYESASAFITMFRKTLGKPPARYLAERNTSASGSLDPPRREAA